MKAPQGRNQATLPVDHQAHCGVGRTFAATHVPTGTIALALGVAGRGRYVYRAVDHMVRSSTRTRARQTTP
jgi:hypothetical protein